MAGGSPQPAFEGQFCLHKTSPKCTKLCLKPASHEARQVNKITLYLSPRDTSPTRKSQSGTLIDDGVRLDKLSVYFGQMIEASGLSYYPRGKHTEEPWHDSTHGHGTVMANMIARINPWVSLCVIRAHDIPSRDGSHMITPRSTAKAIWAAIGRKVNLISMTWTILSKVKGNGSSETARKPEGDRELEGLRKAIDKAVENNILIFCSANDDISLKATIFSASEQPINTEDQITRQRTSRQ